MTLSEETDYGAIGTLFSKARAERGETIRHVAAHLHIRPHYLEAIEEGTLELMPSAVYLRGYMQAYADYLGLDKDEILRRMDQIQVNIQRRSFALPTELIKEKKPTRPLVLIGLGMYVLLYLIWYISSGRGAEPPALLEPPPVPKPEAKVLTPDAIGCFIVGAQFYPPCIWPEKLGVPEMPWWKDVLKQ